MFACACVRVVPVMLPLTLSSSTFLWLDPRMGAETERFCQTSTVRTLSSWSRKERWRCSACWLGGVSGTAGKGAAVAAALPLALSLCAGESASARSDGAESVVALETRGSADALEATLMLTPAGRGTATAAAAAAACAGEAAEGRKAGCCCPSSPLFAGGSMWKRGSPTAGGLAIWLALLGESGELAVLLAGGVWLGAGGWLSGAAGCDDDEAAATGRSAGPLRSDCDCMGRDEGAREVWPGQSRALRIRAGSDEAGPAVTVAHRQSGERAMMGSQSPTWATVRPRLALRLCWSDLSAAAVVERWECGGVG